MGILEWVMVAIFVIGYAAIALEHKIGLDKAASAIVTGVLLWVFYALSGERNALVEGNLMEHLGDISSVLFFLLSAMAIVTLIDLHNGFSVITNRIHTTSKARLLWILSLLAFFLSALLDNLTTTIVMISLIDKVLQDREDKVYFSSFMIIAANAGGAFSPIGDVTTTMLWIGGQITTLEIMKDTFLASFFVLLIPLIVVSFRFRGQTLALKDKNARAKDEANARIMLICGVVALMAVPVFKQLTHLPPIMGMLLSLGFMWIVTSRLHRNKTHDSRRKFSVSHALEIVDTPTIFFFLGILLAVSALQSHGLLNLLASWVNYTTSDVRLIGLAMGILSAIIDNVPLVAAVQGMYSLETFPTDHAFWQIIALACGTGGSMIIIGSAAGVAAMGMQKIDFFWYLKKMGWLAFLGFLSGSLVFWLQHALTS